MRFNKWCKEITIPDTSSLVKENVFLHKEMEVAALPIFDEVQKQLPKPIWNGRSDVVACYWRAWEIAFANLRQPVAGSGFVSNFIDTAFNGCLFMWDSSFILMFGKYANRVFDFQKTLDNLYAHQHRDGFICREILEDTGEDKFTRHDPSATGPDIMAWSEWEYFLSFGDKNRLSQIFSPLMAYHRWMAEHHTWPDGSYFSSGWGCGMDNTPRLMPGYSTAFSHGHMIWVDACMQEFLNCTILTEMAQILGRTEYVEELMRERDILNHVINERLWDESTGFYYDLWKNGQHSGVRHIGSFWALIARCASESQAHRLIEYLENENEFKTPHRVPSLTKSHTMYSPEGTYWAGSVWSPTNYMVLRGLDEYGYVDLSHRIGVEHLNAVVDAYNKYHTLFENYAPERSVDGSFEKGIPAKADFVGWTGLSAISVLFEFVFGIKPNVLKGRISWHVHLLEKHGVEQYPFGPDGVVTLVCEARAHEDEEPEIHVLSNVPIEIEIIWGKQKKVSKVIRT